jgi:hypothetical protein
MALIRFGDYSGDCEMRALASRQQEPGERRDIDRRDRRCWLNMPAAGSALHDDELGQQWSTRQRLIPPASRSRW